MESEDYSFYQGLVFLLENDVQDLGYELTFSTDVSASHVSVLLHLDCSCGLHRYIYMEIGIY